MAKGKGAILVTGATGQQGGAVARELLARQGAEIVKGDLNDAESLRRALQGAWGVFAVQNTWEAGVEGEEAQGKRIAEIARKNGVQYYVYTSVASAHRNTGIPHFDNKWRIEETVRGLAFPSHVIIRPSFFMENFLSPWFKPGIDQGKLMMGIKPTTVLQMIAVADIGKYGLLAFEKPTELNRREIDIAGDAHTMPETANILSKAAGRTIVFQQLPIAEIRKSSEDFAIMLEWFDRVGYDVDIAGNGKRYGIKPTTLGEWAASVRWD